MRYIIFQGSASELTSSGGSALLASDFVFDRILLQASQSVTIPKLISGACPRKDIFDRPILRSSANQENVTPVLFGDDVHDVDRFPSALLAAQEFSFGSTKVRHASYIDVVQIANNIANSANGQKTQSYSFVWSWQDTVNRINKSLRYRRQSSDSFLSFSSHKSRSGIAKTVLSQLNLDRLCGSETALA